MEELKLRLTSAPAKLELGLWLSLAIKDRRALYMALSDYITRLYITMNHIGLYVTVLYLTIQDYR